MDRIFGRSPSTEKPKPNTEEQAAFEETQALIRRVSGADDQSSTLPPQEERVSPFADSSKARPQGDVRVNTPVSTVGIGEHKINAATLQVMTRVGMGPDSSLLLKQVILLPR